MIIRYDIDIDGFDNLRERVSESGKYVRFDDLKAYADEIRRECLETSMAYIEYVMSMWPERCFIKSELREKLGLKPIAIIGKEAEK